MSPLPLSRFLGVFSLVLGATELAIPRLLSRQLGTPGGPWLVRAFGLRELAAGLAVLKDPGAVSGPASRTVGDALDIAVLVPGVLSPRHRKAAGLALLAVLGVTALDVACTSAMAAGESRRKETARRTRWTHPAAQAAAGPA